MFARRRAGILAAVLLCAAGPSTALASRAHGYVLSGTVVSVARDSLVMQVTNGGNRFAALRGVRLTVFVTTATKIDVGGPAAKLTAIRPGERISVSFRDAKAALSGIVAALQITSGVVTTSVRGPRFWIAGDVLSVSSQSLVVRVRRTGPYDKNLSGSTLTILAGAGTQVRAGKKPTALSSIKPGDRVGVLFARSQGAAAGLKINVQTKKRSH